MDRRGRYGVESIAWDAIGTHRPGRVGMERRAAGALQWMGKARPERG